MDWDTLGSRWQVLLKRYRYILVIILAGLLLITMPDKDPVPEPMIVSKENVPILEEAIAQLLSRVEGAGAVQVLLTELEGEEILYQTDETISSGTNTQDIRKETILVSGSDRMESGLVRQRNPPKYLGAVILCQGADKASVRLTLVDAVSKLTGLGSDKICVLKMK